MKRLVFFTEKYFIYLFALLIVFSFFTRVWRVTVPKGYMFDEVYHALTAKLIARGDERAYEWWHGDTIEPNTAIDWLHPPLAKLFQAVSIRTFGENEMGWRFSSVVFGTLVTGITVMLALELFTSKPLALMGGLIFSLDGLAIAMSRLAMNDIHVTFFIVLSALLFYRMNQFKIGSKEWNRYSIFTGIAFGLALASKWSGFFVLPAYVGLQLYHFFKAKTFKPRFIPQLLFTWLVIPGAIYLFAFGQMWLQGKDWAHFRELNNQIWHYQTTLEATHPYQSVPLQWMLNLRPVWMYVDYSNPQQAVNVYAHGNTMLYWIGILTFSIMILRSIAHKDVLKVKESKHDLQVGVHLKPFQYEIFFLLIWYFIVWLPWSLSPRIMFFYHYTPAVPFLSLLVAYGFYWLWQRGAAWRYLALVGFSLIVLNFILFYPNWTALPVSKSFQTTWYQVFESWK